MQDEDPVEATRRRLMEALRTGTPQNPDQLAQDRAEAARRGTTVQHLRAARETGVTIPNPNWHSLPARAPATAGFLSNPANAAVAHDDIENMSAVERIFARIGQGTVRIASEFAGAAETTMGGVEPFVRRQLDRVGIPSFDAVRDPRTGAISIVRSTPETYARGLRLANAGEGREPIPQGITWEEFKERPLERLIPFALEEGIVSLPDMAAAIAALPMYVASRAGGISQERAENDARPEATVQDLVAALPAAAGSALLERLGTRGIIGLDDAVRGGARGIPGAVGRAAVKEAGTEALQEGIEYAGATVGTEAGFDPVTALDRMAQGAVVGGPFGATVRGVTATAEVALGRMGREEARAEAGDQASETLGELATLAEASKLREREPATFQEFVDQVTENGPVENVYVEAEVFAQNMTPELFDRLSENAPEIIQQLAEAQATGGDLRMTAGEFATHIAGTDASASLLPHLRTDPFAMSQAQAKDFMATRGDALQAEVETAAAQAQTNEELRAGRERVQAKITAELDSTGRFTSDVNKAYASLPSAFYDVMGARLGFTAEQAAERYPLRFAADLPTSAGREVMDQPRSGKGTLPLARVELAANPTQEDMARAGRVESVPIRSARATQETMEWQKFEAGEHPETVVAGFGDRPVAVRLANGEYLVVDGHHRTVLARRAGETHVEMHVIDAKDFASGVSEETVDLVHFSDSQGLTATDPSKWGATRATQNSERERRNAGAPGRTYFGVRGVYNGEPAVGIARRPFQYQASVPASKLYDFDADPQGLRKTGPDLREEAGRNAAWDALEGEKQAMEDANGGRGLPGDDTYDALFAATSPLGIFSGSSRAAMGLAAALRVRRMDIARLIVARALNSITEQRTATEANPNPMRVKSMERDEATLRDILDELPNDDADLGDGWRLENGERLVRDRDPAAEATAYEQAIQAAGFSGYRSDAVVPGAVAMFDKIGVKPTSTTDLVEKRFSPENIGDLLKHDDWSILTAENPRGEQATPEANAKAQAKLVADLKALGVQYLPAIGRYGQVENSFVVAGITEQQARDLGRKYDQDSVLTRKGLIYQDGSINPARGIETHAARPDDFFTEVPGTGALFTVDVDFDTKEGGINTETAAFKAWFGDSKVVDEGGQPLVVYHGTNTDIDAFTVADVARPARSKNAAWANGLGFGSWFSAGEQGRRTAGFFAYMRAGQVVGGDVAPNGNPAVYPAFLSVQNPVEYRDHAVFLAAAKRAGGGAALRQKLTSKGHDGAVIRNATTDTGDVRDDWIVFEPTQIKSVFNRGTFDTADPRILYQSDTFYSALERAVGASSLTKAPAAQWKATLVKTAGVKKEELEWSGLNEWLDMLASGDVPPRFQSYVDAKGNVERNDILTFLRNGGVQVDEVMLGGAEVNTDSPYASTAVIAAVRGATTRDDAVLQLENDGTAYRVLQTRHPELFEDDPEGWVDQVINSVWRDPVGVDGAAQFGTYKLPGADDTYREILLTLPNIEGPSTHWDEPNVVAHARVTMREDAEGKRVLFLEELQSDWHQKGRDEGYQQTVDEARVAELREAEDLAVGELNAARERVSAAVDGLIGERIVELNAVLPEAEAAGGSVLESIEGMLNALEEASQQLGRGIDPFRILNQGSLALVRTPAVEEAVSGFSVLNLRATELRQDLRNAQDPSGIPDAPFRNSWSALIMKRMIRYAVDNGAEKIAWINGNQQNGGQTGGDGSFFYERNLVNTTNDLLKKYGARVGPVDMIVEDNALMPNQTHDFISAVRDTVAAYEADLNDPTLSPDLRAAIEADLRTEQEVLGLKVKPRNKLGIQNGFEITPELAEAARAGFALFQQNRGQIAFGQDVSQTPSVISLLRAADLSTFIHETGHFFLEATAHMANQLDAPADIIADMSTVLNWFEPGLTLAEWNGMSLEQRRPYHEKWARGFEAYHFEGRAPSLALRDVFRRFSAWLKNVYKSLTALDVELTDEVRQVMDRMLASEAEITEMEQVRGLAPAFASKPEFMTADQWTEYQKLGTEATAEAIEQLEQRSARDMRWASGAKDRYVRSLQREADEQRKAIRAEVTAEVMAEPVNRARNFLRRGLGEDGEPVEGAVKLDLATLKELYGDEGAWTALRRGGKYGEVATDGAHPDVVAAMFGYPSGEAMIADMVNGEIAADKIKGLTDQRMLERYGDLSDPQAVERAANEAVANDARAKFVAAEMAAADKSLGKRSILNEAARDFAAGVVNRLELKRLRPAQYLAAQGRAAKAAEKALKADDLPAFAAAKRNQLINLHTGRAVMKAQADVEKNTRLFTRIASAKDDAISRTRNMDLVNEARAILSLYGFGRVKNDPLGYMEALKRYDPVLYADLEPFINAARASAKPIPDLTYEEFQGLRDVVGQLWALSRRVKQIEIDGKLVDLKDATDQLSAQLDDIGMPADRPGTARAMTDSEERDFDLLGVRAALRRVESWARGLDKGNRGVFRKFMWNPVSEAADAYRAESGVYIKRFRDLLDTVRDELKPRDIAAPEIGYTFGGKSELYHALLHTGNGSNKSKLLLGRTWGKRNPDGTLDDSRWQALIDRLHAEGVLTAKDWTFVQAVWDMLEDTKAGAQRAHRTVYGRYFDEIAADPVDTPFGQLRGGYVPALTDQNLVQDAALRAEQEAIEGGDSAMFPAASNGFTKSRVEDYTRELALDLRLLPSHVDKVLKFTHLGPPVRDVMRILKSRSFSAKLQAFDPTAQTDLLLPWLQRAAKQIVETPSKGRAGKWADRAFSYIRSNVGMQLMFANVVNTAQQLTGFSGVLLRVKASNLNAALFRYTRDPKGVTTAATDKSVLLRNRANSDIFEARQAVNQLVKLNPNAKDEAVDFMKRHAYFMQSALQNVMDVVSWSAAYDQAVAKGETDAEAIRFADSVIRETQGSMAPEDVSRFETGAPFVRVFTQFAGYFNMMANLAGTEVQLVARGIGVRKGAGRLFYVYLMTLLIPAVIGDAIAKGLRGGWEDEEEDGILNDLIPWFFASQAKFALAAVPGVGQAANAAMGAFTDAPYDDRISMSPAVSVLESGLGTPAEIYQSIVEGESFDRADTRDALNLIGIITGTPAGVLAKPVGYGVGVAQGDIEPTGPVDAARGVVTGAPSPESRQ